MPRTVFVGRFQPLHNGHVHAVNTLTGLGDDVILVIGSADTARTAENPLNFTEREKVLKQCFPDLRVVGVPDVHNDQEWVEQIEQQVDFDKAVSGNDWTRRCFEQAGYPVTEPDLHDRGTYRGTRIRERIRNHEEWKHLVPDCAHPVLEQVDFEKRVRDHPG